MSVTSSVHSGSSRSRRYRTRAYTSQVDETLFATPKKLSASDNQGSKAQGGSASRGLSHSAPNRGTRKPETVRIITKDLIRDLRIPSEDPSGLSVIMCPQEFQRITSASRVLTAEEKEAELAAQTRKREAAIEAAEDRKARLRQADFSRRRNAGLSELEAEARDKAQYLLERANALRMEQEDEIKHINELILGSQCHAIRDTQILEKKQILSELQEEEKRLDAMMEVERRKAIKMQEEIDEMRKQQRIEGKVQIIQQMAERQEERLLNEEFKEQEGQHVLDKLEQLQVEEMENLQRKWEEQRRMQREIQLINEANLRAKERKKEEERLADLHALEYTRKKLEREAEYEAEQERIKKEKEQDVARLRALQERDRDHRAEQDALRARRNQEAAEREWRRKEKQDALNKAKEYEELTRDRLQQVAHKEHLLSVEAGRERSEFNRVLRALETSIAHDKEKEEKSQREKFHNADGVRKQIREREAQAIENRRENFREGERLNQEARDRRAHLDEIKFKKLRELREAGLPEKYCKEVERKIHVLPTLAN
ncbi:cilia- and flagella-associated protein 45 [Polyodon spathula]|uniref:cilia- and flagella-associated protein 45 n=1 Tax=Polyodon spathula TaxID=7913 RepID=UPI001B7DABAD|nr:cilia- and flagella-associated protein 45 [Polyodon spathula]